MTALKHEMGVIAVSGRGEHGGQWVYGWSIPVTAYVLVE